MTRSVARRSTERIRHLMRQAVAFTVVLSVFLPPPARAAAGNEVVATGEAAIGIGGTVGAKNEALRKALRSAVEQGVGVLLNSSTIVKNMAVLEDKIYSAADGFVSKHTILEEGADESGKIYRMTIRATVDEKLLESSIQALRIEQIQEGLKRAMVVYRDDGASNLPKGDPGVNTAVQAMNRALQEKRFRVFDQEALSDVYKIIDANSRVKDEDLVHLLGERGADYLIVVRIQEALVEKSGHRAASVLVSYKAFECSTGLFLGSEDGSEMGLAAGLAGSPAWDQAASKAIDRAVAEPTQKLVERILSTAQDVKTYGNTFMVILLGLSDLEADRTIEFLEGEASSRKVEEIERKPGSVQIELLWSDPNASRLARTIRQGMEKKGLSLVTKDQSGSRIILEKGP